MKFLPFCVFASALFLFGCVNGSGPSRSGQMNHDWENFEGEQRDWQTSTEAYCRRLDGLEIYGRGQLPRRPYLMLGRIKLGMNPIRDRETPDQALARICHEHGADGVILFDQKSARTEYGTLVTVWWYDAFRYRPETTSTTTQQYDPSQALETNQVVVQQTEAESKLFEGIKTNAENGDADSQYFLGGCYMFGYLNIQKNDKESIKWLLKAAGQGHLQSQLNLGLIYSGGVGSSKNLSEAVKWYRKAAEQGSASAQTSLGMCYFNGDGLNKDVKEAIKWLGCASEQNDSGAQCMLGIIYESNQGVPQDINKSAEWYLKAAEQGVAVAQSSVGVFYAEGRGVSKNYVEAYKWFSLAAAQGMQDARDNMTIAENRMTKEQVAEAQHLAQEFNQRIKPKQINAKPNEAFSELRPTASGTGFYITDDGYLISNYHVIKGATKVRLVTSAGLLDATVVKVDTANDLALLKTAGKFAPLPIAASRAVKLGGTVATVGFPDIGLQGFAPKLAKGEIASLAGAADDPRYFQISLPVQPGNSGGALVDARGNVVGIVAAKLSARAALDATGSLPENVNYAVKSSLLLSFLESVPAVSAKLKEPNTKDEPFEDVVKSAQDAAVLVLVY
jgi:TPR repeat protein